MGDGALDATKGDLTHWFRASDKTSDLVGQRQASTFQTLAALAGHGDLPAARSGAAEEDRRRDAGLCGQEDHRQEDDTQEAGGEAGRG